MALAPTGEVRVNRYILDTNVVSELRKPRPHGAVVAWMRTLKPMQIFVSAVTIGELQYSAEVTRRQDKQRAEELDRWISEVAEGVQLLDVDVVCAREWARIMQRKAPEIILDGMIAATAMVNGLALATRDEADFKQFGVEIFNPFRFK